MAVHIKLLSSSPLATWTKSTRPNRKCPVRILSRGVPRNGIVSLFILSSLSRWMIGSQKRDRLAVYSQQLVEVDDRLQSGELTPGQEVRFRSLLIKTLHQIAEERGELPSRSTLELDLKSNPFAGIDEVAIDDNGDLHPVRR
jgi:hypothetical protein